MDNIVILTADDEEPICIRCDNLTEMLCCRWCGSEYGWANYQRSIETETKQN